MMHTKPHWHALMGFRQQWQLWLAAQTYRLVGCLPLVQRAQVLSPQYRLPHSLARLEVQLGRSANPRTYFDGPAYPTLCEHVRSSLQDSWPWVSPGKCRVTWQRAGLDLNNPAVQSYAQGLKAVWAAHQIWWPRFHALMCPQGSL